ncbi:MAG: hypothetical protein L6R43_01485 [Planctomycetes bacterium]|nr:hypothetical protein [Planctomycetota bacterium]
MSMHTLIQWTDSTVNPVGGCGGCELWVPGAPIEEQTCYAGHSTQWRKGKNRAFAMDFNVPELFPGRMAEAAAWSDLLGKERA